MVDVRKIHGKNQRGEDRKANWSKWMLAAAASAAMASAMPSCSNSEEGPIPIPPVSTDGGETGADGGAGGMDGGGCVPNPAPACFNTAEPYEVELPAGSVVSVGDLTVRMISATENAEGVEVAQFDILDSCGQRITTESINEGQTKVYLVTGTNLEITITAVEVSITDPKVKLSISVRCTTDGGVTDGGTTSDGGSSGGDGGSGGMDSGTGGMDSGTGGTDSGTGGTDSGTGGMDGGVTDGGTTDSGTGGGGDGGAGGDGGMGGMDSGTGGMDSGTGGDGGTGGMDGGLGGTDGGVTDGGTTDGGSTDGGGVIDGGPACGAASTGVFSGLISNGSSRTVGGYVFTYLGVGASGGAVLDVECGGGLLMDNHEFPEDIETTIIIVADGKKLIVTPHSLNNVQTNIDIQVANN